MTKSVSWDDLKQELGVDDTSEEHRRAVARLIVAERVYRLVEMRKQSGLTQQHMADAMGVGQQRIARLENGGLATCTVPVLSAYVAALGGQLEVVANFGDERMVVR